MNYPVINFIKRSIAAASTDGVFIFTLAALLISFSVFAVAAYKKESDRTDICVYYGVLSAAFLTVASALYLIAEAPFPVFAFYFAVSATEAAVLLLPLKYITFKKKNRTEEKELIKYIDGEIKREGFKNPQNSGSDLFSPQAAQADYKNRANANGKNSDCEKIKCETRQEKTSDNDGINFSHVKSVLGRLEYFDLSPADRKQMESLKDALDSAENSGFTPEKKSKINDGLSGLLKIMSKYGV